MNVIAIIVGAGFLFWIGYVVYAQRLVNIFNPDRNRKTPAWYKCDGMDYMPAKHWSLLFGHHFSSIAGAAPIIGPILAVSIWGWAPTLLWIVFGTILIGGVHDYCSLMISVREDGRSIADIAQDNISRNAKFIFLSFAWLTLILVIAVFVYICAKTLALKPSIVMPSIGLIPLAIVMGFLFYAKKLAHRYNQIGVTILGLFGIIVLMYAGTRFPISLDVANPVQVWGVGLLIYAYVASIMPVHILLQPRDYISAFLLFAGLVFGYIGLVVYRPDMQLPAFIGFSGNTHNMLWPVLFVTVACGAISGFHSLVASGTTSKQLSNEVHAKPIGYGGMVLEACLAILALMVVAAAYSNTRLLQGVVNSEAGPIAAFGFGYGQITRGVLAGFGGAFAVLILNAFIFTTLDTATRIARYLTQELFSIKNRYLATFIVVAISGWLGLSGEWSQIWPIFGAANQLIAALALIVITSWLLLRRKPVIYTVVPAIFMVVTTIAALCFKIFEFIKAGNMLLLAIALILVFLACVILYEAVLIAARKHNRGQA
jgi:carbon starvation protein